VASWTAASRAGGCAGGTDGALTRQSKDREEALMTRLWPCVVLATLCCLPAVAWTEGKPLAERVLDTMLERCKVLERTDRKGECESARVGADAPRV
jgi:hypothetical protein